MSDTDIPENVRRLLERVDSKKAILDARRPLPAEAVRRLHEEFRLAHTYNSNAIEGNTLSQNETKLVIDEGITIGGKPLKDHLEATGNAMAFDRMVELARNFDTIDHVVIQELHGMVTRGLQMDSGRYRTANVRIAGAAKSPPDFSKVPRLMDEFISDVNGSAAHPVMTSARLHHRFVQIHPFSDGNGRVARLLANLFLMSRGYPPAVLRKEGRKVYYRCLARADAGDIGPLAAFVARALDESLALYLATFGGQDALIPLSELARGTPYTQEYLSLRARQGMLGAAKVGNSWQSSRRALREYVREHGR